MVAADTFFILLIPSIFLYFFNTKELNFLYIPTVIAAIALPVSDFFSLHWFEFISSHRLVTMYSLVGLCFLTILMFALKWNYSQAFPTVVLLVSASSYYWELPYIIRNLYLIGIDYAFFSHLLFPVPFIALYYMIGVSSTPKRNKLLAIAFGFLVSIFCMVVYPIPPGAGFPKDWDSLFYLSNRVACMCVMFYIFVSFSGYQKFRYREKNATL